MPKLKTSLEEIIARAAKHILSRQNQDGSFPGGHNGPYCDPETPVRNTAHCIVLFANLHLKTGNPRYKQAAEKAVGYLQGKEARPSGQTFYCRTKSGKDRCNGLVGQAWVIESLVAAAEAFDREDCLMLAIDVFALHTWEEGAALWHRREVDGTVLSCDGTFNHQLWFAAAGSLLKDESSAIRDQVQRFLGTVAARVKTYPNGTIFHASPMQGSLNDGGWGVQAMWRRTRRRLQRHSRMKSLYSKSVGYHAFNLHAFAMLKSTLPENALWRSRLMERLLNATTEPVYVRDLSRAEFGYRYNLAGIETAYALETFNNATDEASVWLQRQFDETYLNEPRPLGRGVADANTALARIYEATRLTGRYEVNIG